MAHKETVRVRELNLLILILMVTLVLTEVPTTESARSVAVEHLQSTAAGAASTVRFGCCTSIHKNPSCHGIYVCPPP
jgi:hypothetical protein